MVLEWPFVGDTWEDSLHGHFQVSRDAEVFKTLGLYLEDVVLEMQNALL